MNKILITIIFLFSLVFETNADIKKSFEASYKIENYTALGKKMGSAFIVDGYDNLLITNKHVVTDAEVLRAVDLNNKKYFLKVEAISEEHDLAILSFMEEVETLNSGLNLCKSSNTNINQEVFSVGHPEGRNFVLSKGYISTFNYVNNLGQEFLSLNLSNFIGGQSGSAVKSLNGCVLGVVVARNKSSFNMGYAIRVEDLNKFLMTYMSIKIYRDIMS